MTFLLGDEAREHAKRSIKALKAHALRHSDAESAPSKSPVFLVLNTTRELVKENDYTPRIIPLTHKLDRVGSKSVALICRDGDYRKQLKSDPATEDVFNDIVPFSKLRSIARNKKAAIRFFKENDVLTAEARVYKRLPEILGAQFYGKNKRVPYKVLMSEPLPGKVPHGKPDTLCEPKYVRAQVKSILGNTSYIVPAGGRCISIVVGHTDMKVSEMLTNINDVIEFLTNQNNGPNGGLLRSVANLHSVLIKLANSVALPVMPKKEVEVSDHSDFEP